MVGLVALAGAAGAARADIAAAFADGHGGIATQGGATNADGPPSATGLGFRLGARLLIFEGYYDYTGFGSRHLGHPVASSACAAASVRSSCASSCAPAAA